MNTSHPFFSVSACACATILLLAAGACKEAPKNKAVAAHERVQLTSERISVDPVVAMLCRGYIPAIDGPHAITEAHLFASAQVLAYAKGNPAGVDFPVGSVFTKEKYHKGDTAPHMATTMTRIGAKGDISDWQFGMHSLPDHAPVTFDHASCVACHERYAENGFVSAQTRKALRECLSGKYR